MCKQRIPKRTHVDRQGSTGTFNALQFFQLNDVGMLVHQGTLLFRQFGRCSWIHVGTHLGSGTDSWMLWKSAVDILNVPSNML